MFTLSGKTAFITGAGSGIGAAIAATFADAGAAVYLADCDPQSAARQALEISGKGGKAAPVELDVTSEDACVAAAAAVHDAVGSVDVVVNNAGIGAIGALLETPGEDMDRLYKVNVRGIFNVSKAFLPKMIAARRGNIINMASVGGVVGIRDRLAYCTTKFAVVGMTKCFALDYAADGIRANCICPARVETPFITSRIKASADPK